MRAAQYDHYGAPDVLHEGTAPMPSPGRGRVLVKVHGTSVNQVEVLVRKGALRIATGFRFPKGMGMDYAGEVAALGEGVAGFSEGDRVWGFLGGLPIGRSAAGAEFVVARAKSMSVAPKSRALVELAGLPMVAETALLALRVHGKLAPGERLLVRGATGGVGSCLVQLGHAFGAHVTALAGKRNLDFVHELGADESFDYKTTTAADLGKFDVIVDVNGTDLASYRRLLAPGGRMVTTAVAAVPYILFSVIYGPRRVRAFSAFPKTRLLAELASLVERGDLRPIVDAVHPLSGMADAHAAVERGGGRGKQVVSVIN